MASDNRDLRFDDLQGEITRRYPELSKRLQQIGRFALDHPDHMAIETIAEISERASVQPSAIMRFAKAFGFRGFSDMQRVFQSRLVERTPRYRERIGRLKAGRPRKAGSTDAVLAHFVEAGVTALHQLYAEQAPGKLERAVKLLARARTIHVVGHRRAYPVAAYLAYGFSQLGCAARLLDNVGGMLEQQAARIGRDDAVVAISFHSYAPETVGVAEAAHRARVPLVAITDSLVSPLTALANVSFELEDAQMEGIRSLTATMCLAVSLVVSLGQALDKRRAEVR